MIPAQVTNQPDDQREWVVFIDTNPAFTIYTEMAICAGTRLIVPCTADDYSLNALLAMFELIYGWANPNPTFSSYAEYTFAHMARSHEMPLPKLHLFINNRTTQYSNRSSSAFRAIQGATADKTFEFYETPLGPPDGPGGFRPASDVFTTLEGQGLAANEEEFMTRHFRDMRDMHQFAIVSSRIGCPLYAMTGGNVQIFEHVNVKVNLAGLLQDCRDAIRNLANDL